jgi:hypothetical protein
MSDIEDRDDTPSSSDESDLGLHDAENNNEFGDDQGNDEGDDGQQHKKSEYGPPLFVHFIKDYASLMKGLKPCL